MKSFAFNFVHQKSETQTQGVILDRFLYNPQINKKKISETFTILFMPLISMKVKLFL